MCADEIARIKNFEGNSDGNVLYKVRVLNVRKFQVSGSLNL